MDIIFIGGSFIVLWLCFGNIIENHNNQSTKSNDCSNDEFPMINPKVNDSDDNFSEK